MRRSLLAATLLVFEMAALSALYEVAAMSYAWADVPRAPPRTGPAEAGTPPKKEAGKAACGAGSAVVMAGIGAYGLARIAARRRIRRSEVPA